MTQFAEEVALDSIWPQLPRHFSQQGMAVPSAAQAHPVWGRSQQGNQQRVELLHLLLHSEAERLAIWATPRASKLRSRVSAFVSGGQPIVKDEMGQVSEDVIKPGWSGPIELLHTASARQQYALQEEPAAGAIQQWSSEVSPHCEDVAL